MCACLCAAAAAVAAAVADEKTDDGTDNVDLATCLQSSGPLLCPESLSFTVSGVSLSPLLLRFAFNGKSDARIDMMRWDEARDEIDESKKRMARYSEGRGTVNDTENRGRKDEARDEKCE